MQPYWCPVCGALVFFDSSSCLRCGTELGYRRESGTFVAVTNAAPCVNRDLIGCNWAAATEGSLCGSCALTRTRPADADTAALAAWADTEGAKRVLVAQLDALGLAPRPRADPGRADGGLAFDLLSSSAANVVTGHADGVVTIDLAEGADPHREAVRIGMHEPYRTLLGHLRHETGHYYWPALAQGDPRFTELFGDPDADYAAALAEHYDREDDGSWRTGFVSRYAAAHPWEDWAETFAQYLHVHEVLRTAAAWGLRVDGPDGRDGQRADPADAVRHTGNGDALTADFDALVATWLPLSLALNELNRGMGHSDLYPYTTPPPVLAKLRHVHERIAAAAGDPSG